MHNRLCLKRTASIATYQTILKNVVYTNSSDNPDASIDRTVTVVVNDGHDNSAEQVATIHIQPLNDALRPRRSSRAITRRRPRTIKS